MSNDPAQDGSQGAQVRLWATAAALVATCAALVGVVVLGRRDADDPARCPQGTVAVGARCCMPGQSSRGDRCDGAPARCPDGFDRAADGCVVRPRRVRLEPGRLKIGPGDWEAQGVVSPGEIVIDSPYWLDAFEATVDRWNQCVQDGQCAPLGTVEEPGRPVRGVTYTQSASFCRWAGGALPTEHEWVWAAAGARARRYPWGDTGAVCRRACWGLKQGPCALGGAGPDWAGLHRADQTPEGLNGMAGSVAEWVTNAQGGAAVRGGSWKSSFAPELRTWHSLARSPEQGWDDVGVRCRYDRSGADEPAVLPSARP